MKKASKKPWRSRGRRPANLRETNYMGADVTIYESIDPGITTEFVGYDNLSYESEVTVLATDTELADALSDGERGTIFVKETPFYATSGGQEADKGIIRTADGEFIVDDVAVASGGKFGHIGYVSKGMIEGRGQSNAGKIRIKERFANNHSATHLLRCAPGRSWAIT